MEIRPFKNVCHASTHLVKRVEFNYNADLLSFFYAWISSQMLKLRALSIFPASPCWITMQV